MKKIVLLLAVLLFGAGSMMAQQDKSAEKAAKQAEKEAKKAEKAAKKAAEEAEANALFEQAVDARASSSDCCETAFCCRSRSTRLRLLAAFAYTACAPLRVARACSMSSVRYPATIFLNSISCMESWAAA